jgi:predicted membrane protein
MRNRFANFMAGRYGTDQLNRFMLGIAMVLFLISLFVTNVTYWIGLALLIYSVYRSMSRDIYRRNAENEWFLNKTDGIRHFFRRKKNQFSQRKDYCFFKCPSCHQEVRVPKGKGRIRITCPKCRSEFEKTT